MDLLDRDNEPDSLTSLEERILRAVEMVGQLREEKAKLQEDVEKLAAERDSAVRETGEARTQASKLAQEIETLRAERTQVRTRIEKLLGQMDLLSAG